VQVHVHACSLPSVQSTLCLQPQSCQVDLPVCLQEQHSLASNLLWGLSLQVDLLCSTRTALRLADSCLRVEAAACAALLLCPWRHGLCRVVGCCPCRHNMWRNICFWRPAAIHAGRSICLMKGLFRLCAVLTASASHGGGGGGGLLQEGVCPSISQGCPNCSNHGAGTLARPCCYRDWGSSGDPSPCCVCAR
jgi:hypothetical protein